MVSDAFETTCKILSIDTGRGHGIFGSFAFLPTQHIAKTEACNVSYNEERRVFMQFLGKHPLSPGSPQHRNSNEPVQRAETFMRSGI